MEITGTEPGSKVFVYILETEFYNDEDTEKYDYSDENDEKGKLYEPRYTVKELLEEFFYVPKKGEKGEIENDEIALTCTSSSVTQTDNKITISYTMQSDEGEKYSYSIVAVKK